MEKDKNHYKKLIHDYKSKYQADDEEESVSEEHTAEKTGSVFTTSFGDTLRSDELEQATLLDNLIAELNRFAEGEEVIGEDSSDALVLAKVMESKHKLRAERRVPTVDRALEEATVGMEELEAENEGEEEEEGLLQKDILEDLEDVLDESQDLSDEEREKRRSVRASRELILKRNYVCAVLDNIIPEYEEELSHYLREGEEMLLAEDIPFVLRSFGANPSIAEARQTVEEVNKKGGKMTTIDFLVLLADHLKNECTAEDVLEAFRMIDLNDNGEIPIRVLSEVLTSVGEKLTDQEMEEMVNEGDLLKEGFLRYKDFVQRMERNKYVANPTKRKQLIKVLRKEDRKRVPTSLEETQAPEEQQDNPSETEFDPLLGM